MSTEYEQTIINRIQFLDADEIEKLRKLRKLIRTALPKKKFYQFTPENLGTYLTNLHNDTVSSSLALIVAAAEGAVICQYSEDKFSLITFRKSSEVKDENLKTGYDELLMRYAYATALRQIEYANHVLNFFQLRNKEKALYQAVSTHVKLI